ncbi:MAG: glycosyltransferase [Deltaproteobacteria bacterium]|nr:glycosyltransferase [Deltaproteobacteria bacterium]
MSPQNLGQTYLDGETHPFVSIIIPAKNEEKILPSCLDSILSSDYPKNRFEILLIDNGSTDKTIAIAQSHGLKIIDGSSFTIGAMRNLGVKESHGDLIAFVDADVIVTKSWLASGVRCLQSHPNAACAGSFPLVPENFGWVAESWWFLQFPVNTNKEQKVEWLASMNIICRRDTFENIGGFNLNLMTAEDVDFCYRIGAGHDIFYCPAMIAYHYGEAQSLRQLFLKERWRGNSNYEGIRYHGFVKSELPSLLLPIINLTLYLTIFLAIITLDLKIFLIAIVLLILPSIVKSTLSYKKNPNTSFHGFLKMFICYLVYSTARTVACIDWLQNKVICKLKRQNKNGYNGGRL